MNHQNKKICLLHAVIWMAMNRFSNGQCEISHTAVQEQDGEIEYMVVCGCFAIPNENLKESYKRFAEYLKLHSRLIPDVKAFLGFSYNNPGVICLDKEITYDEQKSIVDMLPETANLYSVIDLDKVETIRNELSFLEEQFVKPKDNDEY